MATIEQMAAVQMAPDASAEQMRVLSSARDVQRQESGNAVMELRRLQAELCHLQTWVKAKGLRVIVIFEGRDGAGKGGTIRAITERVSPRVFRVVALPARASAASRSA